MAGDSFNRGYDSSPDPLAISTNENTASARRTTAPRLPLRTNSPSKQNRTLDLSGLDLSSPAKSMIMSTPRVGSASPWRIKVTVQAEPGSDDENADSPSVKRVTRTTTTTVPLKDPDAQTPAKRPRGRPRKSNVGITAKPKRNGTPLKKARPKSRDASVGAAGSSAADVDTDVPLKKRRGRPRKSIQPQTEDDETLVVQDMDVEEELFDEPTSVPVTKQKATGSKRSARFATRDVSSPAINAVDASEHIQVPVANTPTRTVEKKQMGARKGTPYAKKTDVVLDMTDERSDEASDVLTPSSDDEEFEGVHLPQKTAEQVGIPQEALDVHYDDYGVTADPTTDNDEVLSSQEFEDEEDIQDATNFAFEEGTTRMPDDTTVLDSENFSMISVDSLPSNGGFSSPPKPEELQGSASRSTGSLLRHEYLRPATNTVTEVPSPRITSQPTSAPYASNPNLLADARPVASPRYTTPAIDIEEPSEPPAIQPIPVVVPKTETPKLGRVVTAGVALQGLLDPSRITPDPSQRVLDAKRDRLKDLFRGFSEGTRKELRAGLRLGEQLAEGQTKDTSTPSSPVKAQPEPAPKEGVFRTRRKYQSSRLLTPEDQEDEFIAQLEKPSDEVDVQYPSLHVANAANSLLSPASSEDEMSWRVDTPPVKPTNTEGTSLKLSSIKRGKVAQSVATSLPATGSKVFHHDDYADIWQEEASRSTNSDEVEELPATKSLQLQECLADNGSTASVRGKIARTSRRPGANEVQCSDEAESPRQVTPPPTESMGSDNEVEVQETGNEPTEESSDDDDNAGEASDDTGMFFQSNMPSVFKKTRPYERRQRKQDKVSLSSLLNQGESLIPESSPPVVKKKSSSATNTNPFVATPPRFPGFPCSPSKSSPLRREIRGSDISSDSLYRIDDESSLPLIQSSPFRTIVDGQSMISTASDQRQFRFEMEGVTASSTLRIREEANEYLDAYEAQERSLNEITEVTEPSRTWYKDTTVPTSGSPRRRQNFAQSMLLSTRKPVPLFNDNAAPSGSAAPELAREHSNAQSEEMSESSGHEDTEADSSSGPEADAPIMTTINVPHSKPPTGLLDRASFNLFDALSRSTPPAAHPILARYSALPRIEPWTKTHYKALDKLYATHLKHLALFSPSITPATPLSNTNTHLLRRFLAKNKQPYVGAMFSAWGYSMIMTEPLVVLCAVFMELLSLDNLRQYEETSGEGISMGDCAPGLTGETIKGEEVVRRLATVVMGEDVRRDEKKGIKIDRTRSLEIRWP